MIFNYLKKNKKINTNHNLLNINDNKKPIKPLLISNEFWLINDLLTYNLSILKRISTLLKDYTFTFIYSSGHSATETIGCSLFGPLGTYHHFQKTTQKKKKKQYEIIGMNEFILINNRLIPRLLEYAYNIANGHEYIKNLIHIKLYSILQVIKLANNPSHYIQTGHDIQYGELFIYYTILNKPMKLIRLRRHRYEIASSYTKDAKAYKLFHCFNHQYQQNIHTIKPIPKLFNILCPNYKPIILPPIQ